MIMPCRFNFRRVDYFLKLLLDFQNKVNDQIFSVSQKNEFCDTKLVFVPRMGSQTLGFFHTPKTSYAPALDGVTKNW